MELQRIEIEPNDDGTFQIEASYEQTPPPEGCCGGYERKSYSAASKDEAFAKIGDILDGKDKPEDRKPGKMKEYLDKEPD